MNDQTKGYACFMAEYTEVDQLIKVQVAELEISRLTYHRRARSFARKALSLAGSRKRVHAESLCALGDSLPIY